MFLDEIVAQKRARIASRKTYYASLCRKFDQLPRASLVRYRVFQKALTAPGKTNIIAEVKKASPSKGLIRPDFDPVQIARVYETHGAAAISVLTEEKYFLGSAAHLKKIADNVHIPVLAKDFFIDETQIREAAFNGASAVLLIAAILTDNQMRLFLDLAAQLDLDTLVEVHDRLELQRAMDCGADIIGINNRDLRTFAVDLKIAADLIPRAAAGITIVVESGLSTTQEIKQFQSLGASAFLIGESLLREPDMGRKLNELCQS
ncbi:MAG: indole-3-glycerol phosphate synthase TrpC [Candidatus Omnitrophica bacterium]|nr:indole-3-glycerol phosphate synthase TrpC [Candidatus Omnitrophota bacterium]